MTTDSLIDVANSKTSSKDGFENTLTRLGKLETYKALPEKIKGLVFSGMVSIQLIDTNGRLIEEADIRNLKGNPKSQPITNEIFTSRVEVEHQRVQTRFHLMNGQWSDVAINLLFETAQEKKNDKSTLVDRTYKQVESYVEGLEGSKTVYLNLIEDNYRGDDGTKMKNYCLGDRETKLGEMKGDLHTFGNILSGINSVKKESK